MRHGRYPLWLRAFDTALAPIVYVAQKVLYILGDKKDGIR